ncbi:MAG: NHL repeat-containing protein [Armatimonadetes bacterium]|nr:NHL repeat-containing protein [Armatimonadota bacterium]
MRGSFKPFLIRLSVLLGALAVCQFSPAELLVSNYFGNNVSRFDSHTGKFLGILDGGSLKGPLAMRVGPDGLLYVCSESNNTIQRFNLKTHQYVDTIVSGDTLKNPAGIAFDAKKNILVGNFENSSITKYKPTGEPIGTLVESGSGQMKGPDVGLVVGPDRKLYVPSFYGGAVLRFDANSGKFLDAFVPAENGGLTQPRTILFRDKKVWITSDNGNKVLRYRPDGAFIDTFVQPGLGGLKGASGMAFGDDGFLYVTSWRNNQVLRYRLTDGSFVDSFISSGLRGPTFLLIVPDSK